MRVSLSAMAGVLVQSQIGPSCLYDVPHHGILKHNPALVLRYSS